MAIPREILDVERPTNTKVYDSGRDSTKRYSVKEVTGSKYIKGKNPQPIIGKTIGYIIDGKFVPKEITPTNDTPVVLSYGMEALIISVSQDIFDDLIATFPINVAYSAIAYICSRIIDCDITLKTFNTCYQSSWISKKFAHAAVSPSTMTNLIKDIGLNEGGRRAFNERRMSRIISSSHLIIDGMIKVNTSRNDFSAYSRKSKIKGCEDISMVFLYDKDTDEPILSHVYPGNELDSAAYTDFIKRYNITKGILIADKGFSIGEISHILKNHEDLHYITPLKRGDKREEKYNLLDKYEGCLTKYYNVYCKKVCTDNGHYLYSFRDMSELRDEMGTYSAMANKNKNFSTNSFSNKFSHGGIIIFESDLDMDCEDVYSYYKERWFIELLFNRYKNELDLDTTKPYSDYSIIGSEFLNTICSIINSRIVKKASAAKIFDKMSYSDMCFNLKRVWRFTNAPEGMPRRDDGYWSNTIDKQFEVMEALDLCEPGFKPENRKKGRPPKDKSTDEAVTKVPKKRGRPRKDAAQN